MTIGRWRMDGFKALLATLFAGALMVSVMRLFVGLGPVTNLSDTAPWGLWKAFDVIVVVPLGAAGFTMAFVRYFLKADRYEHIMRRSVIWAAVAYLSAGARLFFDIGLPWRLPYPLFTSGNVHSALLEVAWCMALYIMILFFENVPRVMERSGKAWVAKVEHWLHKGMPAFVLAGVLLSTMHQSSLGTLYMITGRRMDALWYHPWLNYLYLLTAIAAGLGVTILIEHWSNRTYGTLFQTRLLARLGLAVGVALAVSFVWRIGFMAADGVLGRIFEARSATFWWWLEMLVGYVLPVAILLSGLRERRGALVLAAGGAVAGMMIYRLNVVFTAMNEALGSNYFPSVAELVFTVGWTAGTILAFSIFVENLPAILGKDASVPRGLEESAAD